MDVQARYRGLIRTVVGKIMFLAVFAAAVFAPGWAAEIPASPESSQVKEQPSIPATYSHMAEELRSSVKKVIVIAGPSPTKQEIKGSYEKATPGFSGGVSSGSRAGTPSAQIGGVTVTFPIPILTVPGAIVGGISGKTKREIQEFRDALTKDLAQAKNQPLTNDGLALDVYQSLQRVPGLDSKLFAPSTPIPDDADAILYVSVKDVTIDVAGEEAILTTTVEVTLRDGNDESDLYDRTIRYQDRDSLTNWTAIENALWHDYANFAAHYLGREVSAEVFDRIELRHELRPKKSKTVALVKQNEWHGVSRSTTPTLAWELKLLGGDSYGSWADAIAEPDIYYDVEIYDVHRLVYAEKQIQDPYHKLAVEIDACKTYRWSVRPSYHIGSSIKFGEWMRLGSESEKGSVGKKASEAPAYIQDFTLLKIECGRK